MGRDRETDQVFSYLRDVYKLRDVELNNVDVETFIEKVQRVHQGLSAEHEFAAIASWLGKCKLVTQLDDVLHSTGEYKVPDFLIFGNYNDQEVPFLVEVKTGDKKTLKWTDAYHTSLCNFAKLVQLPLLVAWKYNRLWVLTDTELFEKKVSAHHLSFDSAIKNNLMSTLFGNSWFSLNSSLRFVLKMQILDSVDDSTELLPEGQYNVQIQDAGLWADEQKINNEISKEFFWFYVAGASENKPSLKREGKIIIDESPVRDEIFNLSDILISKLLWMTPEAESAKSIDWLSHIRKGLPTSDVDFDSILKLALKHKVVHHVLDQMPQKLPRFLQKKSG